MGFFSKKVPQTKAERKAAEARGRKAESKRVKDRRKRIDRWETADERSHGVKPRKPRMR